MALRVNRFLGRALLLALSAFSALAVGQSNPQTVPPLTDGLAKPFPAPALVGITGWLNSKPLSLQDLRGKVVLIDFWTYSCINCLRTLPHLEAWDQKYRDDGLVIIGVASPEFKFEQDIPNIKMAIAKYGIKYPIAVDSALATWANYKNNYWPAHYLIDKDGRVVYEHFGEGSYDTTENNIRSLLGIRGTVAGRAEALPYGGIQTPETYLGSYRAERRVAFSDSTVPVDHWSIDGSWTVENQRIVSTATGAELRLHFNARHVYLVLGSQTGQPVTLQLTLNGRPVADRAGKDAPDGVVTVTDHRLYDLIDMGSPADGTLQITAQSPGVEAYAFTFGN